jgi:hypothetical protein
MDKIYIEPGEFTPKVILDAEENTLFIGGASYPENSLEFYDPIFSWIQKYLDDEETEDVLLKFKFDYFNTGSSKCIMLIVSLFEKAFEKGKKVKIEWDYEEDNEAIKECGEEFMEISQVPFELKIYEAI